MNRQRIREIPHLRTSRCFICADTAATCKMKYADRMKTRRSGLKLRDNYYSVLEQNKRNAEVSKAMAAE